MKIELFCALYSKVLFSYSSRSPHKITRVPYLFDFRNQMPLYLFHAVIYPKNLAIFKGSEYIWYIGCNFHQKKTAFVTFGFLFQSLSPFEQIYATSLLSKRLLCCP